MTQQEIQERNKEIALMLGLKLPLSVSKYSALICESNGNYHSDWNWLMEAVEFIETIKVNNIQIYDVKIWDSHCEIKMNPQYALTLDKLPEPNWIIQKTKKEAVFIAVSDFAKLYNENKL